jgi:hypothetical protein
LEANDFTEIPENFGSPINPLSEPIVSGELKNSTPFTITDYLQNEAGMGFKEIF